MRYKKIIRNIVATILIISLLVFAVRAVQTPALWGLPTEVNSSTQYIVGYFNETGMVNVSLRGNGQAIPYFEENQTTLQNTIRVATCSVKLGSGTGLEGTNAALLENCDDANSITASTFVKFTTHNKTNFFYYDITSTYGGGLNAVNINIQDPLEADLSEGELAHIYNLKYPRGFFNVSVSFNLGDSYVSVFAENSTGSLSANEEFGPITYSSPVSLSIYDDSDLGSATIANNTIRFYGNYSNTTDGTIISGSICNITYSDNLSALMSQSSNLFIYDRQFEEIGTYTYNISCNINDLYNKSASGSIEISASLAQPILAEIPSVVNNESLNVYGFANSSLVTFRIYSGTSESSTNVGSSTENSIGSKVYEGTTIGTTTIKLPQSTNGNVAIGKNLQFDDHLRSNALRYNITSVYDHPSQYYIEVNVSPALEQVISTNENVFIFEDNTPLGWLNASITLENEGNNSISGYNNQTSNGPATDDQIVFLDTTNPNILGNTTGTSTNSFTFTYYASDNYNINISKSYVNISGTISNMSDDCSKISEIYICSRPINFADGTYSVFYNIIDFVNNTFTATTTLIVDTSATNITEINDTGDIITSKFLNATWTPYTDPETSLNYYEYYVGTAQYPNIGWNATYGPIQTTYTNASAGPLNLIHANVYYFNVRAYTDIESYTGFTTSDGIVYVDETAPTLPTISDNGAYTYSNSQLYASWNSTDNESGISNYDISIGTAQYPNTGWNDLLNESVGQISSKTFSVTLIQNETYYFTVRAQNSWGAVSQRTSSNGIKVDTTAPIDGSINYTLGDATSNNVTIYINEGVDPESGIKKSQIYLAKLAYLSGECSGLYIYDEFLATVTGLETLNTTIDNGYCYKFKLIVENNAGLNSEYYYYDDIFNQTLNVDISPPEDFIVLDDGAVTYDGTMLHADWNETNDNESGIANYKYRIQYSLNNGPQQTLIDWTNNGIISEFTEYFSLNHTNISHQYKYYFEVTATNGVGLNTTATSDGIIYLDIYPPSTNLISVEDDTIAPYNVVTLGNILINVSGEENMNCVYSPYDIDYSDSQPSCITIGNITSCNLNVTHGTNTFYVICEDSNGNGQDYDENIKITFTAFVLEEINQIVNIDSIEPLTITYLNSTGNQFAQYSSNTQFNASVFTPYLYYVLIESQNGSFSGTVLDTNLSVTPELNISATYINISEISNNNTEVGNSSFRYVVRDAYGMQINSTHTGNYQITFNYTGVSVTNENALEIFEYEYDFNTNQIDYTKYTHHSSPTRNTNANLVTSTTNDFSVFVLVEDSQEQEICDDNIDNDGDGSTDEGCTVVSTSNSGGGGSSNDDDDDTPSRRGGGSGGPVISLKPTCTDKKMNQDESDIDCGGTNCDACNLSKSCSTHTDCSSGYCNVETLICEEATCFDNVLNQDEEEIDCGGETCEQCMRCDDGIKNYGELEIDCGGPCRSCATCFDNVKNQGEIDTDCGGPCKVCGTCYDFKKNNDEEDIDCGGSCDPCTPISEESPKDTQFPIISMIAAFLIIGGLAIIYAMKSMHKHEEIVPQVLIQEPIIEPKFAPIIHIPEIIEVTDDTILKLQRYVNYSLAMEKTKGEIFDYLKNLSWDEEVIDNLIKDAGDPTIIKDMLNMENYIANLYMMHVTSEKIKRELLKNGWDKILIDASMANIGLVSDKEKLDSFVHEELKSGKDSEEIIEFLKSIGWPKKILTKSIIDSQNRFKKDKNEIDKTIKRMVEKGKSIEKIKEKLEEMGFEEDFINHLLQNYSIERNIEVIKAYVNNELKKGILIGDIKDSLIKKGWAIDVINSVIESEFLMKDMSKLLELEKYMDAKFEKGETKEEVTKDLLKKKWADEYIDIVMLKVHIIDDKTDKIKQYVNIRLKKGDAKKKIEDILVSIGWSRRLIKDILENKI